MKITDPQVAGLVAGAAFIASAAHIVEVVDEKNWLAIAVMYPVAIDGLVYVGIRAAQSRRVWVGMIAILIGALYSLAFNAQAEDALTVPPFVVATVMPVCLFGSFLITHTGKRQPAPVEVREVLVPGPERIVTKTVYPELLPIVPPVPAVSSSVPAVSSSVPPVPDRTEEVDKTRTVSRAAAWDVDKAVCLVLEGQRTDQDIAETVGTAKKTVSRLRAAARLLREDIGAVVPKELGVSAAALQALRAELAREAS